MKLITIAFLTAFSSVSLASDIETQMSEASAWYEDAATVVDLAGHAESAETDRSDEEDC